MSSDYAVAPIFLIRLAGAPFDAIEDLAAPETISAARAFAVARQEFDQAMAKAEDFFRSPEHSLSEKAFRNLLTAVRQRRGPADMAEPQPAVFENYAAAARKIAAADSDLEAALQRELAQARSALFAGSKKLLPPYLVFAGSGAQELLQNLLAKTLDAESLARRNAKAGDRERHLLMYLQRVCTKNDTFSQFGPSAWGRVTAKAGITLAPNPGIAAREVFLERWTAHAVAAVINADPEIFSELSPRLNPNGRIEGDSFFFSETGESVPLSPEEIRLIEHCDGKTPVHALGFSVDQVGALVEKKILICAVEVTALEPHAFARIRDNVAGWRAGQPRDHWLGMLQPMADLPAKFAAATETQDRRQILDEARTHLQGLGAVRKSGERFLYSAVNPIAEECFRGGDIAINPGLFDEVVGEAAPWIDLWRDTYAFVAGRVASGLRQVFEKLPANQGAMPLPAFLRACESAKLPLTGPGLVALAVMAFQEVKAAFRERLKPHAHLDEYELTADDCHVVRNSFQYSAFDEYTWPSADLQLAAASTEAVARGDYQWVLAELHPPVALLHHCMYWSCPDKTALNDAFARSAGGKPNFHFGFFAADFTAHTTVRLFNALKELAFFVAPQKGKPEWKTVPPADAEVYIDKESGDVGLRRIGSGEYLGSFARAWLIPLGFHPFQFGLSPHTPRLRCGRVIVQRRTWAVSRDELPPGDYTGVSRHLVVAIEELRAQKNWPRHIYIRPTEQALRRSGAEGRDKDTKPVFIDLESYLFLEIFYRWLTKAGELEVTEMLPNADQLLWQEADGRHTFEFRTLIVPKP